MEDSVDIAEDIAERVLSICGTVNEIVVFQLALRWRRKPLGNVIALESDTPSEKSVIWFNQVVETINTNLIKCCVRNQIDHSPRLGDKQVVATSIPQAAEIEMRDAQKNKMTLGIF